MNNDPYSLSKDYLRLRIIRITETGQSQNVVERYLNVSWKLLRIVPGNNNSNKRPGR